jgi:hypothetical protein
LGWPGQEAGRRRHRRRKLRRGMDVELGGKPIWREVEILREIWRSVE